MPTQMELEVQKKTEAGKVLEGEKTPFNLFEFLNEVRIEFLKISWPSRQQAVNEFFSVLILVSVITGTIFLIDRAFNFLVSLITGRLF